MFDSHLFSLSLSFSLSFSLFSGGRGGAVASAPRPAAAPKKAPKAALTAEDLDREMEGYHSAAAPPSAAEAGQPTTV